MIAVHPVHRRMAELFMISKWRELNYNEMLELQHCVELNANLVVTMDSLKNLSLLAYERNDMDWMHDLTKQIDELEASCI